MTAITSNHLTLARRTTNDDRVLASVKRACEEWDGFAPHGSSDWIGIRRLVKAGLVVCVDSGTCQTCREPHDCLIYRLTPKGSE